MTNTNPRTMKISLPKWSLSELIPPGKHWLIMRVGVVTVGPRTTDDRSGWGWNWSDRRRFKWSAATNRGCIVALSLLSMLLTARFCQGTSDESTVWQRIQQIIRKKIDVCSIHVEQTKLCETCSPMHHLYVHIHPTFWQKARKRFTLCRIWTIVWTLLTRSTFTFLACELREFRFLAVSFLARRPARDGDKI